MPIPFPPILVKLASGVTQTDNTLPQNSMENIVDYLLNAFLSTVGTHWTSDLTCKRNV